MRLTIPVELDECEILNQIAKINHAEHELHWEVMKLMQMIGGKDEGSAKEVQQSLE